MNPSKAGMIRGRTLRICSWFSANVTEGQPVANDFYFTRNRSISTIQQSIMEIDFQKIIEKYAKGDFKRLGNIKTRYYVKNQNMSEPNILKVT